MNRLGVAGCGVMGSGIAELGARGGCDVIVVDVFPDALAAAQERIHASLTKAHAAGKLAEPVAAIVSRLSFTSDVAALADREIVIEAIREAVEDKVALIAQLDTVLSPEAIIATNTSSIPVAQIAAASSHPGRVLGTHFFNPVPVMPLVEVVPCLLTDPEVADRTHAFCADVLGKKVIRAADRSGFVVNAILVPYLLSAIRSLQNGVASLEDIDEGMVGGCGMPMGPMRLCDMIGLDTMLLVSESLYAEHLDAAFAPPALLKRHVEAGLLGRKSGRGFYDYAS
ncbi:MAG: 3-hydroxybutyryl-CoA dehydrogenase [Actinomycetota bacterium]|jgi:3-hydroxybutyryl-CoA dehydrogenase|nr:3-hydroxybutyryl-CoA dehydrogenase [Actinomycetota bacterium]